MIADRFGAAWNLTPNIPVPINDFKPLLDKDFLESSSRSSWARTLSPLSPCPSNLLTTLQPIIAKSSLHLVIFISPAFFAPWYLAFNPSNPPSTPLTSPAFIFMADLIASNNSSTFPSLKPLIPDICPCSALRAKSNGSASILSLRMLLLFLPFFKATAASFAATSIRHSAPCLRLSAKATLAACSDWSETWVLASLRTALCALPTTTIELLSLLVAGDAAGEEIDGSNLARPGENCDVEWGNGVTVTRVVSPVLPIVSPVLPRVLRGIATLARDCSMARSILFKTSSVSVNFLSPHIAPYIDTETAFKAITTICNFFNCSDFPVSPVTSFKYNAHWANKLALFLVPPIIWSDIWSDRASWKKAVFTNVVTNECNEV